MEVCIFLWATCRIVSKADHEEVAKTTYKRLGKVVQNQKEVRGVWNRAFGCGMSVESDGVLRTQPGLYRFWRHRPTLAKNTLAVVVSSPHCLVFSSNG